MANSLFWLFLNNRVCTIDFGSVFCSLDNEILIMYIKNCSLWELSSTTNRVFSGFTNPNSEWWLTFLFQVLFLKLLTHLTHFQKRLLLLGRKFGNYYSRPSQKSLFLFSLYAYDQLFITFALAVHIDWSLVFFHLNECDSFLPLMLFLIFGKKQIALFDIGEVWCFDLHWF